MITRLVKLTLKKEKSKEFKENFESSKQKIRAFEGCRYLDLLVDVNNPNVVFTYSIWDSEQHLHDYTSSNLFKSIWKAVKPMFSDKAEAWSTEVISTTGSLS